MNYNITDNNESANVAEANQNSVFVQPIEAGRYQAIDLNRRYIDINEALENSVRHDIRSPLTILYAYSAIFLRDDVIPFIPKYATESLEKIREGYEKIRNIVDPESLFSKFMSYLSLTRKRSNIRMPLDIILPSDLAGFFYTYRFTDYESMDKFLRSNNTRAMSEEDVVKFLKQFDSNISILEKISRNSQQINSYIEELESYVISFISSTTHMDPENPQFSNIVAASKGFVTSVEALKLYLYQDFLPISGIIRYEAKQKSVDLFERSKENAFESPAPMGLRLAAKNVVGNAAERAVVKRRGTPYVTATVSRTNRSISLRVDNLYNKDEQSTEDGRGSGLRIARTLVEDAGGLFDVDDKKRRGPVGKFRVQLTYPLN